MNTNIRRYSDENEFRDAGNWLDMVLACMSDGLTVFDRRYRLVYMNRVDRERSRELGLDPDSLLGKVLWTEFPGLAGKPCARRLIDAMEQRVSVSFEESTNDRWFEVYLSPTEDGGIAALTRDITDRKRAEEELSRSDEALRKTTEELEERVIQRTSELAKTVEELRSQHDQRQRAETIAGAERQRLDRLTELLPIGIMLISPTYHVLFQNRFVRERFGDADSRLCYELLFERAAPCDDCNIQINAPRYWESLDRMGRAYSIFSFPFAEIDGSPVILVVSIDMTERKAAQEQLQTANQQLIARAEQLRALLKELSRTEERQRREFAQMLHDEVQQLMVAIKFSAEYLAHQITNEEQRHEVRRIIDLVAQSINVTRSLTSELSPPVLHEGDFASTLHWLSRWMKENHGLEVELRVERPAPPLPEELRIMLFQSVRELLFNVVKHSGVARAALTASFDEGKAVHVTVEDRGKGFNPAEVSSDERGGFGLFNVRERIALLNGSVEMSSSPRDGARISLHVPIPQEKAPRLEKVKSLPVALPDAPITEPAMIRVLIVDDHTVVRQGLVEILSKQPGMVVVGEAVDGQQAVEQVRDLHPTLALMDISLPKLNGIEATRIITHEFQEVRVIGLSMHKQEDVASRMQEAGAARYMSKDCPVDQLVNAIYETMNVKVQPVH